MEAALKSLNDAKRYALETLECSAQSLVQAKLRVERVEEAIKAEQRSLAEIEAGLAALQAAAIV